MTTADNTDQSSDQSSYSYDSELLSDLYKGAYGFRPDYSYMKAWYEYPDSFKQEIWNRLLADLARAVAQEHQEYLDSLEGKTSNDQHD